MALSGELIGFSSLLISSICFGFMFAPLRKYDSGDGLFVQWVQCAVVFIFGFFINIVRKFPPFNPVVMIGGLLYATGNVASVPVVQALGIGVGFPMWGTVQVLVGWSVARFGLFGTRPQPVYNNVLNIVGVFLNVVSGIMFAFVEHESQEEVISPEDEHIRTENMQRSRKVVRQTETGSGSTTPTNSFKFTRRKIFFIALTVFLGTLHGLMMTPVVYVMDNDPDASHNVLDFVSAYFSTVFMASTMYFLSYCIYKRNKPYIKPELVLPSVAYGVLFCVGMTLFFVSNDLLSQVISFPITVRLPSTIGIVADMVLFRVIKGKKNILYTISAVLVGIVAVVFIAISNQKF
ncbi:hypothetical protein AB6A40_004485 [Gnathostoma spinigerum]|uniref:Transmembrane protein n=1 Tax=Gnathostoma spinigerum TaxID=75299 RepID=A0ABD6EEX8_9BILA